MEKEIGKFKIGDRIIVIEDGCGLHKGDTGTICHFDSELFIDAIGIEFDKELPNGHTCRGHARHFHGFYLPPEQIEQTNKLLTAKEWKQKKK